MGAGRCPAIPAIDRHAAGLWQALTEARHRIEAGDGHYRAFNPGNNQRYRFAPEGLRVRSTEKDDDWEFGLRLSAIGSPGQLQPVQPASLYADGQRIEYRRGTITEWYQNKPIGLEQGFTIQRPIDPQSDTLVVRLAIEGGLQPRWQQPGRSLSFHRPDGGYALSYDKLVVTDARQRRLPAHLALNESGLEIRVSADGAAYPIVIDPLIFNEQKVTAQVSDAAAGDLFGYSVALSGDTALVGAIRDDDNGTDSGSAYVFRRSGTSWSQQAKLTASDGAGGDWFGYSVALSGDTALVGAYGDDCAAGVNCGSAYVFVEPGSGWANATQDAKLTASDAAAGDFFGRSVALSGDTALVGAEKDDCAAGSDCGSAYLFVEPGSGWADATQDAKLTANDAAANDYFGYSVALSGDTALVGAYLDACAAGVACGSAYVFVEPGSGWADASEDAKLTASDAAAGDQFGWSVAVSGDTALVGAYTDGCAAGSQCGSAYVFDVNDYGQWGQQAKLLPTVSDAAAGDVFGWSVALSGDTALVGAYRDDCAAGIDCGSAYFYTFPCGFGGQVTVGQWSLMGLPCTPAPPGTVASALGDDFNTAGYGNSWIMWQRDAVADAYQLLGTGTEVDPGVGYWLKALDAGALLDGGAFEIEDSATPVLGTPGCASDNGCVVIQLGALYDAAGPPGWNMVANPLPYPVSWADVRILVDDTLPSYTPSGAAGFVDATYQVYNGSTYIPYNDMAPDPGVWQPGQGLWIKVLPAASGHDIKLLVPAAPSIETGMREGKEQPWYVQLLDALIPAAQASEADVIVTPLPRKAQALGYEKRERENKAIRDRLQRGEDWFVRLKVEAPADQLKDPGNLFGQLKDSKKGYDARDLMELPPFGTPYLTLVFPHADWGDQAGNYARDFHGYRKRDRWDFEIRTDEIGRELELCWEGPDNIIASSALEAIDEGQEYFLGTDPDLQGCVPVFMTDTVQRFRWEYRRQRRIRMRLQQSDRVLERIRESGQR